MEVLLLLSKGTSLTTIAERLHLSVKTISTYRTRILDKMGIRFERRDDALRNRTQARLTALSPAKPHAAV